MPIIAVDLGNSRAKFGYFSSPDDPFPAPEATLTDKPGDWETLRGWLDALSDSSKPILWGVARTGSFPWDEFRKKIAEHRPLDRFDDISWEKIPISIDVEAPEKVGIDRILAAFAVLHWRRLPNSPKFEDPLRSLIVDAGSAITVDLLNPEGAFAGGAILPGLDAASGSLAGISSRLPRISTENISFAVYPGKNTEEALAAGIYWGAVGAVCQFHSIVRTTLQDAELPNRIPVFLTGGNAEHLRAGLALFIEPEQLISIPDLVLSGIALAIRENHEI